MQTIAQRLKQSPGVVTNNIDEYAAWRGKMYFTAREGTTCNLWVTGGTRAGTGQVIDPSTGLDFAATLALFSAGANFFFAASDASYGREPWVIHIAVNELLYLPYLRR